MLYTLAEAQGAIDRYPCVIIAVSALWCQPSPEHFQELARLQNSYCKPKYYYLEVQDENFQPIPDVAGWEAAFPNLQAYPTTYYFRNGRLVNQTQTTQEMEGTVQAFCPPANQGLGGAALPITGIVTALLVFIILVAALWRGKKAA